MTSTQTEHLSQLVISDILPRTKSPALQEQVLQALEHLRANAADGGDLLLLSSALELLVTDTPTEESKEAWAERVELLVALRAMSSALPDE